MTKTESLKELIIIHRLQRKFWDAVVAVYLKELWNKHQKHLEEWKETLKKIEELNKEIW